MGTGLKFLFEEEVTMKQGTNLGSQIGRWIILAAVVALLGTLLLTIRPVGAQDAPPTIGDARTVFSYAENGDKPIITYRARDPEDKPVFWTLAGADARRFTIFGGELSFKSPPNFEMPLSAMKTNTYKVTVRFGAGGEDGAPDINDDYDGDDLGELDLTITVTNVDEDGKVTISPLQPQIGTLLRATLSDSDVQVGFGQWKWASSESGLPGTFTDLTAWVDENLNSNADTYRPVDDDLDKYLQVSVRYKDKVDDEIKDVQTVSAYPVRKDIVTSNAKPQYPDQRTLVLLGDAEFGINRITTSRYIPENSPAGTPVGAPVTAFDDETSIDVITYELSDTVPDSNHKRSFGINPATGQITVAAGAGLNRNDDIPSGEGITDNAYAVTVTATDGDGRSQDIDVTITVVKVDEPPIIDRVYPDGITGFTPERILPMGMGTDSSGPAAYYNPGDRVPTEMSHNEARRGDTQFVENGPPVSNSPALVIDTNLDTDDALPPDVPAAPIQFELPIYTAMDPEDGAAGLTWSLEGDDGWLFKPVVDGFDTGTEA